VNKEELNEALWWEIERYYCTTGERDELLRLLSLAFSQGYNEGCEDTRDLDYGC